MILSKIAIMTDSNSGITQQQAKNYGIHVLPMPFFINGTQYFEDIDLTQDQFYQELLQGAEISTSMPAIGDLTDFWDNLLKIYDEIVHIPMSRGLSGSCETAIVAAREYEGKVQVVDNQRISVTQRQSVLDAKEMAMRGKGSVAIKNYLEETKQDSSIYIMLNTLYYLKKGGRITPAAAALGTLLRLKPVLQIQGEKLDAFAKARTTKQGKTIMMDAIKNDFTNRFLDPLGDEMWLQVAYSHNLDGAQELKEEIQTIFPRHDIVVEPLSLSVACHIGPGALAIACAKKMILN
jgi:DegV family protein with EDD domain